MIYALFAIVAVITMALLVLRTNTGVVFLAVAAGSVLLAAAGKDTDLIANSIGATMWVSTNIVQAIVVLLPGIMSAFLLRNRVPVSKLIFAIVPAFCAAVVALTLVYPFLSGSFQFTLSNSKGWNLVADYYQLVVIVGIISSLFTIAVTIPKNHSSGHKKGKH